MALWLCHLAQAFALLLLLWAVAPPPSPPLYHQAQARVLHFQSKQPPKGCDLSQGEWIVDESHYPLYNASTDCPFIGAGFDCIRNGRPDKEYLKYKWKPSDCDLPRFDGKKFLERNRGKKILFVGDSISNNMWQSLTCLLHIAVPKSKYTLTTPTKHLSLFSFPEYGASIMWLKNGFLVDVVRDKEKGRIIKLDTITSGDEWKGVDVLIFNTYHWWTHTGESQTWVYFQLGNELIKDMDHMEAYKIGLNTWARWVDSNIDPSKTTVLYQGIAASHSETEGKSCLRKTKPEEGSEPPYPGVDIVKSVLRNMTKPVRLLDITYPSQLRKDGHPSIYTGQGPSYEDCSHWCLAGVPDTWNEILYAALIGN